MGPACWKDRAMPRFFFDVRDGDRYSRDEHGIVLPDVGRVWEIAVPMVDEIAKAKAHLQPPHSISVVVRDEGDVVVYRSDHVGRETAVP